MGLSTYVQVKSFEATHVNAPQSSVVSSALQV